MILSVAILAALSRSCARDVAPQTLLSLASAESGLDPLTIGVNSKPHRAIHPAGQDDAVRIAKRLLAQGANLDLGLMQINSRNLASLGLSIDNAFDPCRNLAGGARILTDDYLAARRGTGEPQQGLRIAFSLYNTGDRERGLRNGYVSKIYAAAERVVPAIATSTSVAPSSDAPVMLVGEAADQSQPPLPAPLDVFARAAPSTLVWSARSLTPSARPRSRPEPDSRSGDLS